MLKAGQLNATQVSTEKFARYFDVEARLVPVEDGQWVMHPDRALEMVDENTIGTYFGFHWCIWQCSH